MDTLLNYLNSLPHPGQVAFAEQCGTTVGYLRKALSVKQRIGEGLCVRIELHSGGAVVCERLRPDLSWSRFPTGPQWPKGQPFVDYASVHFVEWESQPETLSSKGPATGEKP